MRSNDSANEDRSSTSKILHKIKVKKQAVITTNATTLPPFLNLETTQIIKFGTGVEFKLSDESLATNVQASGVVLPCIFGSQLQGPVLLATGITPTNVPFLDEAALRGYYE